MKEHYIAGDWWVLCQQCHRKMRASQSTKRWDNLIVHKDPAEGCFETRHPQEFVRAVPDSLPLPFVSPDNDGIDIEVTIDSSVTDAPYNQIPNGTFGNYD
jgi:hypothetical protein